MASYEFGKADACAWVRKNFPETATVLDVGACDGNWRRHLEEYTMDAVEIFEPYLERLHGYRNVYHADICQLKYEWYDLIIFGDIIEHLSVDDAKAVLEYAKPRCRDMIVAVPFLYEQGALNGNEYERHIQDDLTPELFKERYPGFETLVDVPEYSYRYYHKEGEQNGNRVSSPRRTDTVRKKRTKTR